MRNSRTGSDLSHNEATIEQPDIERAAVIVRAHLLCGDIGDFGGLPTSAIRAIVWKGQASLDKRLKAITSPRAQKLLSGALREAGETVAVYAQYLITSGSAGGQSGGKHQHVVSAPNTPPNNEFGDLANGIEVLQPEPLEVIVQATAAHSVPLEFGTSKMAPRPFFRPAREAKKKEARAKFAKTVDQIVKGGAGG